MTEEEQYWEDTQEALTRIFDRCEEIDPQSGYDMLEDIQFVRGFINKHKPRTEKQEPIIDKIRAEIEQNAYPIVHGVNNHELGMTLYGINQVLDKYKGESEKT